jgi:hypothetical protein
MNPWLILGAAVAIGGAYTYGKLEGTSTGLKQGRSEIQQKWDQENARLMEEHSARIAETLRREQELHIEAENARLEKNRALREVNARAVAVTNLLRNRPERSSPTSPVSGAACTCSGTTGAQLAKGDGEFLAGYSADAAKLQAEFDQCLRQYTKVRNSILEGNAKLN